MKILPKWGTLDLVTYGCETYSENRFETIVNRPFVKPHGGLWASPKVCEWGWKDWCIAESYSDLRTYFEFIFTGYIVTINSLADAKLLPRQPHESHESASWGWPDFEELVRNNVGAIYLTQMGEQETRFSEPNLYGWDCECVLVLDQNGIVAQT